MKTLPRLTGNMAIADVKTGKATALFERYWSTAMDAIEAKAVPGNFTASADAPVVGYVTILDITGTPRKVAVIS